MRTILQETAFKNLAKVKAVILLSYDPNSEITILSGTYSLSPSFPSLYSGYCSFVWEITA